MPLFHTEPKFRRGYHDHIWKEAANNIEFQPPRVLWKELWPKFNRITIPLLDENAFFADAVSAAKIARDREELEQILIKKRDERIEELSRVFTEIGLAYMSYDTKLEFAAAESAAFKVVQTHSLDSILQFMTGSVFGWPNEPADQRKPRPRNPVKIALEPLISEEELEHTSFTQRGSPRSISSSPPSPPPGSLPDDDENEWVRSKPPASSSCDDVEGMTITYSTAISGQPSHLPSPSVDTPSAKSDPEMSGDPHSSLNLTNLPSTPPVLYHAASVQTLPADGTSSYQSNDDVPTLDDHKAERYQTPDAAVDPQYQKRRRSDTDSGSDAGDEHRRHKRRTEKWEVDPENAVDREATGSSSAINFGTLSNAASAGVTVVGSPLVDDPDDIFNQRSVDE